MVNTPAQGVFQPFVNYRICLANARQTYIAYRRANFTNTSNAFQTAHNTAKNNADGILRPLLQLQDNYSNPLVETSSWKNGKLLNASYTTFGADLTQTDKVFPASQWSLFLPSPAATFTPAVLNGTSVSKDARYATTPEMTLSFDKGNLVQLAPRTGPVTSYLWGYGNNLPIAEVKNAPAAQVAFTSFEDGSPGGWFYGGWDGQANPHLTADATVSGRLGYRLDTGWGVGCTVAAAGDYVLSFWASDSPVIYTVLNGQVGYLTPTVQNTGPAVNGLRLYTLTATIAASTGLNIDAHSASAPILLDDVRLYPVGGQMTTYTHAPQVGLTSRSDANSQPTRYEYDALMRLRLVRDPATNIRQKLEYNYRP